MKTYTYGFLYDDSGNVFNVIFSTIDDVELLTAEGKPFSAPDGEYRVLAFEGRCATIEAALIVKNGVPELFQPED